MEESIDENGRDEGRSYRVAKALTPMKLLRPHRTDNSSMEVKLHLNVWLLPVLVGAFGILYLLTAFRGWLIFLIGTAGAWLIATIWIQSIRHNLVIERKVHLAWATAGESVPEQVKLINRGWLPAIWVEITDESQSAEESLRLVSDVGRNSYRIRNLNHLFTRRGLYTLGPTRLRCGDPLGIYTLTMMERHTSTILITPPVLPLARLKIPTGGWSGDERHRRGYIARNIHNASLRNYVAGDSLKHIHWRATAHFDDLIVKQLETATSRDWLLFADLDDSIQAGIGERSTLELVIILAASLAMRGLREHRKVGLVLAGPQYERLEPVNDPGHSWRILRALAVANAGRHSLAELLLQNRYKQVATTILITASTDPAWVASAGLQRHGGSTLAILIDPADFGSPLDQSRVTTALTHSRIPYLRMPGSLLDDAYSVHDQASRIRITIGEAGKRYYQAGRQSWQRMD